MADLIDAAHRELKAMEGLIPSECSMGVDARFWMEADPTPKVQLGTFNGVPVYGRVYFDD